MIYQIDKDTFAKLAAEIADQMNLLYNSEKYSTASVEICIVLSKNGPDFNLLSRALVRNPKENYYDMVTDVMGPPVEALETLLKELREKTKSTYDLKMKAKTVKYN